MGSGGMFEITGDDIADLNDEDLRTLIGLLCEAELRRRGHSPAFVTWGGNQTAKDGGLDVRVALPAGSAIDGYVPKANTGFQVKKPNMPRGEILAEMKPSPNGELRPVISELAKVSGAYVIVSANGSTSDSALENRRKAMAEAVEGMPCASQLGLDFYDRNRVATWVRDHAGLITWVRSKIGRTIQGWRAYGSWSYKPEGADSVFLVDDAVRVRTGDKDEGDGISATDGVNKLRNAVRSPGSVVRLVGLSGVGKTRLVEALFDAAAGANALDPALAVYTDISDNPDPQPTLLASDLIAAGSRAILVIDNCPPATHRQLAEIVRQAGTSISLITVEYDIREDQPEGTDVFELDASSPELIERLIEKRLPHLSHIDRKTIAESSGGNARVALALAGTVKKKESVAGLSDAELFKRLFQQRNDPDATLLLIAQACSLVYSFQGDLFEGKDAEIPLLGALVGKSGDEVFAAAAELKKRHLLQTRGPWRAILPHAIANRLATTALEKIPHQKLMAAFQNGPPRLLRSFSRRLGYLDSSETARRIVEGWLGPDGLLSEVANLNELGQAMFANVAPVAPGAVLTSIEKALTNTDADTLYRCKYLVPLLRSLAYDAEYFTRAVTLLMKFAALPTDGPGESEAAKIIEALFYIVLSGTHAPLPMRLKVVERLLGSADAAERELGLHALGALLKTSHFIGSYHYEFGARSRDYGYHPPDSKSVADWYSAVLDFAAPFAVLEGNVGQGVRDAIASEFPGLWTNVARGDELERIAQAVAEKGFWREGWIGVRQTRIHDEPGLPPDALTRLKALEELLRPKDLIDQVRGVVLNGKTNINFDDFDEVDNGDFSGALARMAAAVERLGRDVAADEEAFKVLLPELLVGSSKAVGFGRGLGLAADSPREMWRSIVAQASATPTFSTQLLYGFLEGLQIRDRALADTLLDAAVDDVTLAPYFPIFQAALEIDATGLARLHRSLDLAVAPIDAFYNLAYGRACDSVPGPELKKLVLAIGNRPGGKPVALEILMMRIHSDHSDRVPSVPEIAEAGRLLLSTLEFQGKGNRHQREDYQLGIIAQASLAGEDGKPIVRKLCRELIAAASAYRISLSDYDDLLAGIAKVHPVDVLDELAGQDEAAQRRNVALIGRMTNLAKSPVRDVPDDAVIIWCDLDPETRYPFAAAIVALFDQTHDEVAHAWRPIARHLLLKAPDKAAVLGVITDRVRPTSGIGPISSQYETRLKFLETLDVSGMPSLAEALTKAKEALRAEMQAWRRREAEEDRMRSSTFE